MTIILRPIASQHTTSGIYIGVLLDNGRTIRTSGFTTWAAVLAWLARQANERQDPAGRDLWNYTIKVERT